MILAVIASLLVQSVLVCGVEAKIPLNILVLVPWPDERPAFVTGWDSGLGLLAGGRVAVKEINNRTDVLHDYQLNIIAAGHEACSLTEERFSIRNLVYHAINPHSRDNVAAVLGLYCSASTIHLSPLAGKEGVDLIHLSASNSPIFRQNLENYPHLWRFLLSADAFADMMIEFMKMYQWTKVGLVQDSNSAYFVEIADAFAKAVRNVGGETELVYHGGLVGNSFVKETLTDIRRSRVRIIFLCATGGQIANLLCEAAREGMVSPNYMWIITDYRVAHILFYGSAGACEERLLLYAMRGSITSSFDFGTKNETFIESSNITYKDFVKKYDEELKRVRIDFQELLNKTGDNIGRDVDYGGILYDQVWAFALAVNNSIPELRNRNISIQDYRFGQPNVTDIIEENLKKLNFRGVSWQIQFSKFREAGPPIAVFQVDADNSEKSIGTCLIVNGSISCDQVEIRQPISDDIESVVIKYPLGVGILFILLICAILIIVTVLLCSLIYHRNRPEIKATSPYLSLIMFIGSYLLCFGALLHVFYTTFNLTKASHSSLCNVEFIIAINGCNLIFITLVIKLFRISRIFTKKPAKKRIGWTYSDYFLSVVVVALCCLPGIVQIIMLIYDPMQRQSLIIYLSENGMLQDDVQYLCYSTKEPLLWFFLLYGYLCVFIACIVYLAVNTRKIQQKNFKDTKKVNALIFLTILSFSLPLPCSAILLVNGSFYIGNIIIILGLLTLSSLSQFMLFLPKALPLILGKSTSVNWTTSSVPSIKSGLSN